MQIDTTINIGNVLVAIFAIISFAVAFTKLGGRIDLLKTDVGGRIDLLGQRVQGVEERMKNQGDVSTRVAVLEVRQAADSKLIADLSGAVSDLRRGQGFIQASRKEGGVDGEWP
jgi:hypothetical protein